MKKGDVKEAINYQENRVDFGNMEWRGGYILEKNETKKNIRTDHAI